MPNIVNEMVVRELDQELGAADGMVVVSFSGIDVATTQNVRGDLAEKGARFMMVRNNLARRVLAEKGIEFDDGTFTGNTAIAYGDTESAISAAKVLTDTQIKKAGVKVKAGLLDGEVLGPADAVKLADIPDRDTLRAQLLGCISGPARGLATVINAVPSSVARVLQARVDSASED
ncbi:MAG: 50S ribosomal protein L10 [bacterium]|nr:50S ribosomal protein L10 [bacterium]